MSGKDYMEQIRTVRRRIRLLKEQIERDTVMASGVTAIRYDKDVVQTSPVGDRMVDIVGKIIETTKDLEEEIHKLQMYEEEAIGYLVQLKDEHERVLSLHYLEGIGWSEVSTIMGYHEKYIYDVRDKALLELDEILKAG